jgi:hypothetical protein
MQTYWQFVTAPENQHGAGARQMHIYPAPAGGLPNLLRFYVALPLSREYFFAKSSENHYFLQLFSLIFFCLIQAEKFNFLIYLKDFSAVEFINNE